MDSKAWKTAQALKAFLLGNSDRLEVSKSKSEPDSNLQNGKLKSKKTKSFLFVGDNPVINSMNNYSLNIIIFIGEALQCLKI